MPICMTGCWNIFYILKYVTGEAGTLGVGQVYLKLPGGQKQRQELCQGDFTIGESKTQGGVSAYHAPTILKYSKIIDQNISQKIHVFTHACRCHNFQFCPWVTSPRMHDTKLHCGIHSSCQCPM